MASLILILAAVGLATAGAVAVLGHLARPAVLGLLGRMPVEQRANLLLVWALLPLLAGLLAVAGVVAPSILAALGLMADHCLLHGNHHSHLCLLHPGTTPAVPGAGFLLGLVGGGGLLAAAGKLRRLERSTRSWRSLRRVASADTGGGIRVLETARPVAATVGLLRPAVFLSRGLLGALDPAQQQAVSAHEAAHRRRRDPLRLAVARLGACCHLPASGRALQRELELAVERAADEAAARSMGDRLTVAEALVAVARLRPATAPGPGFGEDPVAARVQALLHGDPAGRRPWRGTVATLAALPLAVLTLSPQFHHGLETLLGHL